MSAATSEPSLAQLGWNGRWEALSAGAVDSGGRPGRVMRHDGAAVLVGTADGVSHAVLKPSTPRLAVGDWVVVAADGAVAEVLHRTSLLQRRDPSTGDGQPIAANIDVVGIVCGLDRPVRIGRIQRFTALAWDAGAMPLIVLSKRDLVDDPATVEAEIVEAVPGSDVVSVSSTDEIGVAALRERCAGRTLVLVGESGAGKSTLLNALAGRTAAATGDVRGGDYKGRHTTTARQLHVLEGGGCLIDTPGVREVGLATDVDTIDSGFADIAELAAGCRFGDCSHDGEPGCAVDEAVSTGLISAARFDSWRELRREAASAELRADPAAYRRADRQQGRVYREVKEMKRRSR